MRQVIAPTKPYARSGLRVGRKEVSPSASPRSVSLVVHSLAPRRQEPDGHCDATVSRGDFGTIIIGRGAGHHLRG
jgi:hypothetical protein